MKASAALATLLCCLAALCTDVGDSLAVKKCCLENEYVDVAAKECLEVTEEQADVWKVGPRYWLPEWLRAEPDLEIDFWGITWPGDEEKVHWALVDAKEQLGRRLLAVDADARRFVLEHFGNVDVRTVANQRVCFDVTRDPRRPFVVTTWLKNVIVPKCCAKGARLNGRRQCQPKTVSDEIEFLRPLNTTPWVPAHLRDAVPTADIRYNVQSRMRELDATLVDADDPTAWKLLFPKPHELWIVAVWVRTGGEEKLVKKSISLIP